MELFRNCYFKTGKSSRTGKKAYKKPAVSKRRRTR